MLRLIKKFIEHHPSISLLRMMLYSNHIYETLQGDNIRLLFLQPGLKSDPIRCCFKYTSLSRNVRYEALSYMWGTDQATHRIHLEGWPYQVRDNLHDALLQLRYTKQERVLWIDAICINQNDNSERNHQVAHMGMIYRQASAVCIWLGQANTIGARDTVRFITRDSELIPTSELQFSPQWQKLSALCNRPYWKRLWIIQEVALAAKLDIYWGDSILSWDAFTNILRGPQTWEFPMKLNQQRQITKTRTMVKSADIFSLCLKYRDARCADQRDKIFGLLSLADECCRGAIEVDYSLSPNQLCDRVLAHYIKSHLISSPSLDTFVSDLFVMRKVVGEGGMAEADGADQEADESQKYDPRHKGPRTSSKTLWETAGGSWSSLNLRPGSDEHDLKVRGYPRSRVKHVISSSQILAVGADLDELYFEKFSETNEATHKMLECYAHYSLDFVAGVTEDDRGRLLAVPRTNPKDHERLRKMKTVVDDMLENIHTSEVRIPTSARLLHLVWEIVQLIRNPLSYKDCVLFLDHEGMAGLGPRFTRVNDVFVRFKNSESTDSYLSAIVRKVDGSYVVIGRARHLTSARKYLELPIEFGIDIPSLQILTKPTPFDTQFHYISDLWQDREKHKGDFEALLRIVEPTLGSSEPSTFTESNPEAESTDSEIPKRPSLRPLIHKNWAQLVDRVKAWKSMIRKSDEVESPHIRFYPSQRELNVRSYFDYRPLRVPREASQPHAGWPSRSTRTRDTTWDVPGLVSRNF